jgi:hypothetical protein
MRATRYSVPFFISCFVHIVVFALSPGDLFHHAAAWEKAPPIRLRVIGPGSVKRAKGIEDGVSENLPFPKESRREIEKRERVLFPRAVKKGASAEKTRKKVGDLQAKVPDRGPDLPLMKGHAEKIAEKQVEITEDPNGMDGAKGENLFWPL